MKKCKNVVLILTFLLFVCMFPVCVKAADLDKAIGKTYDVTQYGADKTGRTDSSKGVQRALDAARNDIRKGVLGDEKAEIYFPEGTYKMSSNMRLYQGMVLRAEKKTTVTFSGTEGIRLISAADCSITGGTWKGGKKTYVIKATRVKNLVIKDLNVISGYDGIAVYDNTALTLDHVYAASCVRYSVTVSRNSRGTINNSRLNGSNYAGMAAYDGSTVVLNNCEMNKNRYGASIVAASSTFNNCKFQSNRRHALDTGYVGDKTSKITMNKCSIYKNGLKEKEDAVLLNWGASGKFTDCIFTSNAVSAIHLVNDNTPAALKKPSAVIKNCTFKNNEYHDIYLENKNTGKMSMSVSGCKFYSLQKSNTESVRVRVNNKKDYSMKLYSNNKFYDKKNLNYVIFVNNKVAAKK